MKKSASTPALSAAPRKINLPPPSSFVPSRTLPSRQKTAPVRVKVPLPGISKDKFSSLPHKREHTAPSSHAMRSKEYLRSERKAELYPSNRMRLMRPWSSHHDAAAPFEPALEL